MGPYSRHQLLVIVILVAAFGGGLAVDRWRRAHPEAVERLELFDREQFAPASPEGRAGPISTSAPPGGPASPARPLKRLPESAAPLVDLNRATHAELTTLPGIGPALATRIVEARDRQPFAALEDLRRVRGVGAATRERLRPFVTVGPVE